jgi:hypothetical protein
MLNSLIPAHTGECRSRRVHANINFLAKHVFHFNKKLQNLTYIFSADCIIFNAVLYYVWLKILLTRVERVEAQNIEYTHTCSLKSTRDSTRQVAEWDTCTARRKTP